MVRAFDVFMVVLGSFILVGVLLGICADSRPRAGAPRVSPVAPDVQVAETERDGALDVLVLGADGKPLGAAQVRLFWEREHRYFDAGQGVTNDAGQVRLGRVPRGPVWVLADAEDHARASTQLIIEGGARDVKLVLAAATQLGVKVTDEAHAALSDATVLVTTADPLPFGALSDAQGNARFLRLGAPPFTVKVAAPGYESVTRSGVTGSIERVKIGRAHV